MGEIVVREDGCVESKDAYGREILTVGQLKAILADVDDDRHVVLDNDGWYSNIESVAIPNGFECVEGVWTCVTFFRGTEFDSRQF